MNFLKDPLIRRLILGLITTGLFVWVAIRYYGVEPSVIGEFLMNSFAMIFVLMVTAFLSILLLKKVSRLTKSHEKKNELEHSDSSSGTTMPDDSSVSPHTQESE